MALIGASIDFCCLIVLSILISQLHKLLEFWDRRKKGSVTEMPAHSSTNSASAKVKNKLPQRFPDDVKEAADLYQPLIGKMSQPFQLADLYKAARENDYPHPHLTISLFRQAGILTAVEEGMFTWNN